MTSEAQLSIPIKQGAPPPGVEIKTDLATHVSRASIRRLVVGLFDAWDAGDVHGFAERFADDGRWLPEDAPAAVGRGAIASAWVERRRLEPWSLHWLSNESLWVDGDVAEGTWLWSAASCIDHGTTSAWSGGDLVVRAVATPEGWRLGHLARVPRYRTPVPAGWLTAPLVPLSSPAGSSQPTLRPPSLALPVPAPPGPDARGNEAEVLADLGVEVAVRRLMGDHVHATETETGAAHLAERWAPSGTYQVVEAAGDGPPAQRIATGRAGVATLLAEQLSVEKAWIRTLCSEQLVVDGRRAFGTWRDLWTAEVDGRACWRAHRWSAVVEPFEGRWAFTELIRERLFELAYGAGWGLEPLSGEPGQSGEPVGSGR